MASRTLPDHRRCDTHRLHKLGCEQYEQLLERSGQRCEICRNTATPSWPKLFIDHGGWDWAVRGLLCGRCNSMLGDGHKPWPPAAQYLANSWWVKECKRLGLPADLAPEPKPGSAIRDQFGVVWIRSADGLWRPRSKGGPGISSLTWQRIWELRGPHNMAPFDVFGPQGNYVLRMHAEDAQLAAAGA